MKTSIINFCGKNYSNTNNLPATLPPPQENTDKQIESKTELKTELKTKNKGVVTGMLAGLLIRDILALPPGLMILNKIRKVSNVSAEENAALSKAAEEILTSTGLKDKGVEIVRLAKNPAGTIQLDAQDKTLIQELLDKSTELPLIKSISKIIPEESKASFNEGLSDAIINKFIKPVKFGQNAFYMSQINKVITPDKNLQTVVFHELGHALDANGGKISKAMFKTREAGSRFAMLVPVGILAMSLFNRRKVNDKTSENDTKKQKALDFIKRNAGKLTALILGVCYMEEGIASIRGSKAAKELVKQGKLTNDLMKKVNKSNLLGFASYAVITLLSTVAVKAGIAIKDKLQEKYEEKQNLKETTQV